MKKALAFVFLIPVLFAGYWNHFVYLKKIRLISELVVPKKEFKMSHSEWLKKADYALAFHPEIENDVILGRMFPIVGRYLAEKHPEENKRKLVGLLEKYSDSNNPRILRELGRSYIALWNDFGKDEYYEKAVSFYKHALDVNPKYPYSIIALKCLYDAKRNAQGQKMKELIYEYWGAGADNCSSL